MLDYILGILFGMQLGATVMFFLILYWGEVNCIVGRLY